jgi:hypothetical protein
MNSLFGRAAVSHVPAYIWLLVLLGAAGIPALTALGLFRSAREAGADPRRAGTMATVFAAGWAGIIAAAVALAAADVFRQSASSRSPWFGVFAGGVLVVALVAPALPPVASALRTAGAPARLTWPHVLRVVGVVFILMLALGRLPAIFALPAGLGDVAVGLAAPGIARRLARGDRRGARLFHALGLLDLVVAVTIGSLAALGPGRVLNVSPATVEVSLLPLALVPITAVPLAMALHVAALVRLRVRRQRIPAQVPAATGAATG